MNDRISRLRAAGTVLLAALSAAACGGGATGAGGPAGPGSGSAAPATPAAALPPGTSGFPGLDWGDTRDAVLADYPAATGDDELVVRLPHGGRDADVSLVFTGDQLISISVSWPGVFESMDACADLFREVRATLEPALGPSSEENLAAFWSTETASATLSCDIDDADQATLSMSYTLAEE